MNNWIRLLLASFLIVGFGFPGYAEANSVDLTTLSLEELSNLEVISVSKKPEKSSQAPAAVYVITQEDIRRSGVTTIPEALRLAPGVEVSRINANQWSIGIRGFESRLSRSVLVLIDGRSVYNPLFAGTYWELQNYVLGDIDRIEVVRGPGGALWGANAVNGVINIITKSAKDTQGGRLSVGGGSEERTSDSVRYGGKAGKNGYYRAYGRYFDQDSSFHKNGNDFDDWHMAQSGFRTDWDVSKQDLVTVQGDIYRGRAGQATPASATSNLFGANVLSRWSRSFDSSTGFTLQVYYDRTDRRDPIIKEGRDTGDFDFQYRLALPGRQKVTWGIGYRVTSDDTGGAGTTFFDPERKVLNTYSGFIQDQIDLIVSRLSLILGTKLEHNDYSGWEVQPSARLLNTPTEHQTLWAAVSRAVRTPSRLERDISINGLFRKGDFSSEHVVAYEAGYKVQPISWLSMDISGFYNDYNDLLSVENTTLPRTLGNGVRGHTDGMELASDVQVHKGWRLRGSYSLLDMNLGNKAASVDTTTAPSTEGSSPRHQASLHSLMDLPYNTELDPILRYVSDLPAQNTHHYFEMDVRLGWHVTRQLELSLVGQNLLHDHHPEFTQVSELERGVYGKAVWTW